MNKKKKVIIGVLAVILVVAVGYAIFSDTLTINGTATAEGDFNISISCGVASEEDELMTAPELGVSEKSITCKDNVVTMNTTLLYPGSHIFYKITVTNTGTIPVVLNSIKNIETGEIIDVDHTGHARSYQEPIDVTIYPSSEASDEESECYYPPEGGIDYSGFDDYHFTDKLPNGGKRVYYVYYVWDSNDEVQRQDGVTKTFTYEFNYKQPTN